MHRYDSSIKVLTRFLDEKAQQGQNSDKDVADVLYNRACSYSLKSTTVAETEQKGFKKLALEDLKRSIEMSPPNAPEAAADPDFKPIRHLDEFRSLVAT